MDRRTDHYTALLIDEVLAVSELTGINLSSRALLNLGLPLDVTERVLARPESRRGYSPISKE